MWPFTKKIDPDVVRAEQKEEIGLADPLIYTDSELAELIRDNLESGYFQAVSVFGEYLLNEKGRGVSRPYVENEIRMQHPDDRRFWSLTHNPFLERT